MVKQAHEKLMPIDDLAKHLKLSTSMLNKLCADGKVSGQKVGRHWWFRRTGIDHRIGLIPYTIRTSPQGADSQGDIEGTTGTSAGNGPKGPGTLRVTRTKNRGNQQ